jgi:hypothetical protein
MGCCCGRTLGSSEETGTSGCNPSDCLRHPFARHATEHRCETGTRFPPALSPCSFELREEHLEALVSIARNDRIVGEAFHRRFDNRQFWMIRWEQLLRHTSAIAGPLFGDQSIFVKAETFHKMGGFAEIPIMEDIEFSRHGAHRAAGPAALVVAATLP